MKGSCENKAGGMAFLLAGRKMVERGVYRRPPKDKRGCLRGTHSSSISNREGGAEGGEGR